VGICLGQAQETEAGLVHRCLSSRFIFTVSIIPRAKTAAQCCCQGIASLDSLRQFGSALRRGFAVLLRQNRRVNVYLPRACRGKYTFDSPMVQKEHFGEGILVICPLAILRCADTTNARAYARAFD